MPKPVDSRTKYVPALDGLRTVAVAAVLIYHLNPAWAPGGLMGVAVFFTLSGFLISGNLIRAKKQTGSFRLSTFWLRRFRRLMPAVFLAVPTVWLVTALTDSPALPARNGEALSALAYINNWWVIAKGESYFDKFAGPGPLDHMWSLSIEEQFYLLWPLLLALLFALFWHAPKAQTSTEDTVESSAPVMPSQDNRAMKRGIWTIVVITVVLAVASFVWMAVLAIGGADSTRVYEGTDTRAGGLLGGAVLALLTVQASGNKVLRRIVAELAALVGVAGIIALVVLVPDYSPLLFRGGLALCTVATVLAIAGVLNQNTLMAKLLGILPMRWLGERSYGIYLWHLPVAVVFSASAIDNPFLRSTIVVVLSVVLASLSWSLVENPVRTNGVIQPVKNFMRDAKQARKSEEPGPGAPKIWLAAAAVILAGTVAMGLPAVFFGGTPAGAPVGNKAMTVPEIPKPKDPAGAKAAGDEQGKKDAQEDGKEDAKSGAEDKAVNNAKTSCTTIVHVGDSTSIGMFDDDSVPDDADNATNRYEEKGVDDVRTSIFGARATTEGWNDYPSAVDSVKELKSRGMPEDTCWVIATGVNDAANQAVGHHWPFPDRIETMMDAIGSDRVMWATAWTGRDYGPWDIKNMMPFNSDLKAALADYPNLVVYDWAADAQQEWYLEGDLVHYNATGNAERSARFADALAQAFPLKGKAPESRIVTTKGRKVFTSLDAPASASSTTATSSTSSTATATETS